MRKNPYFVNIVLIIIVSFACLMKVISDTFYPGTVFVKLSIPMLVLFSVIALVIDFYIRKDGEREMILSSVVAALTLSVLPACIGWNEGIPFFKLFVSSYVAFFILIFLYKSIGERITSTSYSALSPLVNGIMLYLASQCLQGLL